MNEEQNLKESSEQYFSFRILSISFPIWGPLLFSFVAGQIPSTTSILFICFLILWPCSAWPLFKPFYWHSIILALIYYIFAFAITFFIGWYSICKFAHCLNYHY